MTTTEYYRITELEGELEATRADFEQLSEELKAERAANVLFVAQVTTLTEQRDLCAAEAERLRRALEMADDGRAARCHDDPWAKAVLATLAAPSTAAQVLSERDERVRQPVQARAASASARCIELEKERDALKAKIAEIAAAAAVEGGEAVSIRGPLTGKKLTLTDVDVEALKAKLADVTAERDELKERASRSHDVNICVSSRDTVTRRAWAAETALAASQAHVAGLRSAGLALVGEGVECLGRPARCDNEDPCGLCQMRAVLARESSTDALREFGLRVARAIVHARSMGVPDNILGPVVEAVLKGGAT